MQWQLAHDRCVRSASTDMMLQQASILWSHHMRVQHAWLSFMVPSARWEMKETDLDVFFAHFCTIVSLCSKILADASVVGRRFSLEFGLGLPLFCTALKCRHPLIRREAARLLRLLGTEGLWNPTLWVIIAEEVIRLEELDNYPLKEALSDLEQSLIDAVPLHHRISNVEVSVKAGESSHIVAKFEWRKWDCDGVLLGVECIIRRLEYE